MARKRRKKVRFYGDWVARLLKRVDWYGFSHSPIPPMAFGLGLTLLLSQVIFSPHTIQRAFTVAELRLPIHSVEAPEPKYWRLFKPAWMDGSSWFEITKPTQHLTPGDHWQDLYVLSADPENKVDFEVPDGIRRRVTFWMMVQSKYSRKFRIVHDRDDPGVVYGIIDYRPLYRRYGITARLDVEISRAEKHIRSELKRRLWVVGSNQPSHLSVEEQDRIRHFLSNVGALGKKELSSLVENVRTQTGQVDEFRAAIHRSRQLLPHVESVMARYKLPMGLSRIPFVESSFNDVAHSKVGAMGIWQFMPATAREMISKDSRKWRDPLLQTRAAARLLRNYRTVLPDWGTTITAYNQGVGRIRRMVRRYRLKGVEDLLTLPPGSGLGFAGANFFPQVLAANLVLAYHEELLPNLVSPQEVTAIFSGELPESLIRCTY